MIEVIYHRLFANKTEGKRQLLTCFFEGAYFKKPLIAKSAFFAIASEAELKENKLLREDIQKFLDSIEKTIVFGWWVIAMPGKDYSIDIHGEEDSSQVKSKIESGLNVCFREIQNLTGLAKCVALISYSLRSYDDYTRALSLLNQTHAEIETLKNFDNTHFLSDIYFYLALAFSSIDLDEQALISIDISIETESEKSHYYAQKSVILGELEYYKEALVSINQAIKIDPKNPSYYVIKSQSLKSLRRYNEAIISNKKAIQINPKHFYPYNQKSLSLSLIGDYPAAINSCDRAIQLGGNKLLLLVNKGIVLSRAGEYSKAMKLFDRVIREHPENEEGYYGQACCYARQGDTERAIAALQQAIQIAPRRCCREARSNPDFDSLRNDQQFISLVGESQSRDRSSIDVDRT
jgi:tetratricopeptide (TPR) repeat protein